MGPWCTGWWVNRKLLGVVLEDFVREDHVLKIAILIVGLMRIPGSF